MDHNLFYEITGVLLLAGMIAIFTSLIKQPSILAYILTGLIIGPLGYYRIHQGEMFSGLAEIGITLLLFMAGLGLDTSEIKRVGKIALYTGLGQILFTSVFGFLLIKLLGFATIPALYMAIALTFSSTIIVVKLLSEKKDLQSLYGKIVVGFLLVQDFAAVIMLILLAGTSSGASGIFAGLPTWQFLMMSGIKALILILLILWISRKVFPKLLPYFWKSEELLLIFSIAWALGLAALVSHPWIGFSLEIGGFLAGLSLANSIVHYEIGARIKSLRDFFIIIFFIVLGSQLVFTGFGAMVLPAILLSLFVLIGNPLIVMLIMGILGYKPRTAFFASVTVAQISEFSLVLMALGLRLGHVNNQQVGLITLVGVTTITLSSYMILHAHWLYGKLAFVLKWFDFKKGAAERDMEDVVLKDHVILIGAHRLGSHVIQTLKKQKNPLVIVDFNPEIAERYSTGNSLVVCGDATDPSIQDQIYIEDAKLVVSTIPDFKDNIILLESLKNRSAGKKHKPKVIISAQDSTEADYLYKHGVDYALSPHFIGGMHLAQILSGDDHVSKLKKYKKHHLESLTKRA